MAGRITEYNFNMLSAKYQDEQAQLDEQLRYHCSILHAILSKEELHCNMEHFLGIDTSKAKAVKL